MHSTVRDQAGIGFSGDAYQHWFVLADARLTVVAPLPNGTFRVVVPTADAPEQSPAEFVHGLLDARAAPGGITVTEVTWGSRFRIHHRVAEQYRAGRILLAGDAAHVHSPAGGQGMNLGIQDAVALADALITVLDGGPDAVLDAYGAARRPIARQVVELTDRLTRLATLHRGLRPMRNALLSMVGRVPPATRARWRPDCRAWYTADSRRLGRRCDREPCRHG